MGLMAKSNQSLNELSNKMGGMIAAGGGGARRRSNRNSMASTMNGNDNVNSMDNTNTKNNGASGASFGIDSGNTFSLTGGKNPYSIGESSGGNSMYFLTDYRRKDGNPIFNTGI